MGPAPMTAARRQQAGVRRVDGGRARLAALGHPPPPPSQSRVCVLSAARGNSVMQRLGAVAAPPRAPGREKNA
eukprot:356915-Chlamydomonas_euryale.AAC.4